MAAAKAECFVERVAERTPYYQNRVKLFETYRQRWEEQRAAAAAENVKIQVRAATVPHAWSEPTTSAIGIVIRAAQFPVGSSLGSETSFDQRPHA
jgi:hypothetical protein